MGGRSEGEIEAIAFISASDSEAWAAFLQNKLRSEDYNIQSFLHPPLHQDTSTLFSSSQTCAILVSPSLLEKEHFHFWTLCLDHFHARTLFLFLGVNAEDLRNSLGVAISERVLTHRCLEVDGSKEAVTLALVKLIEAYESTDILECVQESTVHDEVADEKGDTKKYDGDETIYDYPPPPRQQNKIVRVIPTDLYEHDCLDVLVLLEKEAEEKVTMVTESATGFSRHIVMDRITACAYVAKLPNSLHGKVDFMVLAGEHNLGHSSVHVHSRMEQVHCVLQEEINPLTLLCNAMGISTSKSAGADELDSLLAQRVRQFPSALTSILCSEDQVLTDEPDRCQWPTLLHFAAEFNLKKLCEELLHCPGMIHAACTENGQGLFPCQLAERNGFRNLQKRLVQYVEDMKLRRSAADSGISFSENLPPPPAHHSGSHLYVNEKRCIADTDSDYMQMNRPSYWGTQKEMLSPCQEVPRLVFSEEPSSECFPPPPSPCLAKPDDGYAKPRSFSEGCVKTPYARMPSEDRIAEEEDSNEPPPLKPKLGRARSAVSECASPNYLLSMPRRPDSDSSESSDSQEVLENTSKSSTETLTQRLSECEVTCASDRKSDSPSERVSFQLGPRSPFESRPGSQVSSCSSQSDYEVPLSGTEGAQADDSPMLRSKHNKRSKSVQDKISHFFKKIKPSRRQHSSSESDLPVIAKGQKKSLQIYTRQSTMSTSSDPSGYQSSTMRSHSTSSCTEAERDSGAVCDSDQGSPVLLRLKGKETSTSRNMGKRNGASMQRRISVRVQKARNEEISGTPTLPARGASANTKETFVSHIK